MTWRPAIADTGSASSHAPGPPSRSSVAVADATSADAGSSTPRPPLADPELTTTRSAPSSRASPGRSTARAASTAAAGPAGSTASGASPARHARSAGSTVRRTASWDRPGAGRRESCRTTGRKPTSLQNYSGGRDRCARRAGRPAGAAGAGLPRADAHPLPRHRRPRRCARAGAGRVGRVLAVLGLRRGREPQVVGRRARGRRRRLAGAGARPRAGERHRARGRRRAGARDRHRLRLPHRQGQGRRARSGRGGRPRPGGGGARRTGAGRRDPGRRQRRLGRRHRRRAHPPAGPRGPRVRRAAVRVARRAARPAAADRRPRRRRRGGPPLGRPARSGPARRLRRRRPQGPAARRGAGGAAGRRDARPAVRRLQRAGDLGRHRRRRGAGRGAAGAPLRLRAGHGGALHRRRHQHPAAARGRRAAGRAPRPRPAGRAGRRRRHRAALAGAARRGACGVNPSTAFARVLVDELLRGGVTDAVLAPGSRSAPVALALAAAERAGRVRLHVRIDERTAAFLALGLAKASGRPVPVLTTSGTATAHLHAAVLEADASGVPLLALTADRPPELRATGANQTIEQAALFGTAVRWVADVGVPEAGREAAQNRHWRSLVTRALIVAGGALSSAPGPVHLNLPFREPLMPDDDPPEELEGPWAGRPDGEPWTEAALAPVAVRPAPSAGPRTLLVAGDAPAALGRAAAALADGCGWPVVAEPSSGAWGAGGVVRGGALLLGVADWLAGYRPDRVLVVGRPTLSRPVSALLADPEVHVQAVAARPRWADAPRRSELVSLGTAVDPPAAALAEGWLPGWQDAAEAVGAAVDAVLDAAPALTAARLARDVVAALPAGAALGLGAAKPVRHRDRVAGPRAREAEPGQPRAPGARR